MKSSCNAEKQREPVEEEKRERTAVREETQKKEKQTKKQTNKKKKPNKTGGLDLHVRPLVHTHRRQEMQPASKLLTLILLIFMGTELTQVGLLF